MIQTGCTICSATWTLQVRGGGGGGGDGGGGRGTVQTGLTKNRGHIRQNMVI